MLLLAATCCFLCCKKILITPPPYRKYCHFKKRRIELNGVFIPKPIARFHYRHISLLEIGFTHIIILPSATASRKQMLIRFACDVT